MDAFRMIEPPDASERNKPANSLPSIGAVGDQRAIDDQAGPQDRTKAAKVSEHRRRAPIQFMLNRTSQAGQRSGCKQTTFGACSLHRAGVDRYNFG